jgi:hypothetical protein
MTSLGNNGALIGAADPEDMTIGALLGALTAAAHKPLIFVYDGRAVQPGYHVTEVKVGQFQGLDCGANPESWTEIFVQLWDIPEDRPHMAADKFMKIIGKVMAPLALDAGAKLTFEVSDGIRPMPKATRSAWICRHGHPVANRVTAGLRGKVVAGRRRGRRCVAGSIAASRI